ncbi:outer membrane protein assembly factor BamD [Prosthecochloris sp.]|uniref:outer membrane protein assembly factor BamD n=1 Tax=Prosthecochloris sp. TaxID=290513 RepID=UPI0025FBFAFC|nr:outer membrane protein assembly factor BamD [Prosthecochloris sp.]
MLVSRFLIKRMALVVGLCLVTGVLFSACSSVKPPKDGDVVVRYAYAQELVAEEDYDKAIIELESLMFDTRATTLEDDVLFALANAYYSSEQFLLAVDIFNRLLEQTPGSPYAEGAQFMLAKSHKELSPTFSRDQEHTRKAIREFQLYLELYPIRDPQQLQSDIEMYTELVALNPDNALYKRNLAIAEAQYARLDKVTESASSIGELREKLALSEYSIAEQYQKLKKYRGSIAYYDNVIRFYPDTIYYEKAWFGKIGVLIKREKWFEAQAALDAYDQQFPENMEKVEDYRNNIVEHFENG